MEIRYQNVNLRDGNESTLLHFETADGTDAHVLVDSGEGVDVDNYLREEEYLNAVCLTHAHIDHYRSLGTNVIHNAPVYTSPDTASVLERALPEAAEHQTISDVDTVLNRLTPINDWVEILDTVSVRPVSVGHTPGGAGFLFRIVDETIEGTLQPSTKYVLATGDFTTRPCAGYRRLEETLPVDVDTVILNAASDDSFENDLSDALERVIERANGGSRVVIATGALTGIHFATVLGTLLEEIGLSIPIELVGQAAKQYDRLEYDIPNVETTPVFESTTEVLDYGGITIGGPETATGGSSERLLNAIVGDGGALFVQFTAETADVATSGACSTYQTMLENHPSLDDIGRLVEGLAPIHVVVKHVRGQKLNQFQKKFDGSFTWGTDDEHRHCLYAEGTWREPGWLNENTVQRIRQRHDSQVREKTIESDATFAPLTHGAIRLSEEGIDVDQFRTQFSPNVIKERALEPQGDATKSGGCVGVESETSATAAVESSTESGSEPGKAIGSETVSVEEGRESKSDEEPGIDIDETRAFRARIISRLNDIEDRLDREPGANSDGETVSARVLSGGGDTFLQILEPTELEVGELIEIEISRMSEDDTESKRGDGDDYQPGS